MAAVVFFKMFKLPVCGCGSKGLPAIAVQRRATTKGAAVLVALAAATRLLNSFAARPMAIAARSQVLGYLDAALLNCDGLGSDSEPNVSASLSGSASRRRVHGIGLAASSPIAAPGGAQP